jgi:DNA-binding beta-propeller fold protein YncE
MCGLAFDRAGTLWAATGFDGQVMTIGRDGQVLGFAGKAGTGPGEMSEAHMVAVAPNGDVYVTDTGGHKVVKFVRR